MPTKAVDSINLKRLMNIRSPTEVGQLRVNAHVEDRLQTGESPYTGTLFKGNYYG